jgi:hypothetical protein
VSVRLATAVFVSALLRETHARGGSGVVVAKGDTTAGALLLILLEKSRFCGIFERVLGRDGDYAWSAIARPESQNGDDLDTLCARRRRADPDLWIVELDIPYPERFIAEFMPGR